MARTWATHEEIMAAKGFGPDDHVEYLRFGDDGTAWTFVLTARSRGWDVSEPLPNGCGACHVAVWSRGPEDQPITRKDVEAMRKRRAPKGRTETTP